MSREIILKKNNTGKDKPALEWVDEFYEFLQGNIPERLSFARGHAPKLSEKKAFAIIYYLQEHLCVFPDTIERCNTCGALFDMTSSGIYWQTKGKFYCGACEYLVPANYDKGKK